ncbi:MAG: xanthine dehydrogenase family protein molybdopterin-binding subunit [Chloroflexota bacterium]
MVIKDAAPQFMGVRVKRREDPELITGQGLYVADIELDGLTHAAIIRSPYAHAKILSIDISDAEALPGVVGIFTADDVNPHMGAALPMVGAAGGPYKELRDPGRYPLTGDKARHVGDPVAVVVAENRYVAADAAELVYVDYEPLEAIVDPEAALATGGDTIHDEWDNNLAYHWLVEGEGVEEAFASAHTVAEIRLHNQRVIPTAMEPRAVTASYDAETDSLTIWTSTQFPHTVKEEIAPVIQHPTEKIRVIAPEVGGGFGAKGTIYGEEALIPFLAKKLGRPVRWAATRSEDNVATIHGRDQIDILRLAADADGKLLAADLEVIADCGAYYSRVTPVIGSLTVLMMTGVYDIPKAKSEVKGVFTNKVPTEPYRGAGRPEAAYLIERAMNALALKLDMDPVELRQRNFVAPDKFPYKTAAGATYDSGDYAMNLNKALELSDYQSLRAEQAERRKNNDKLLGIGVACYVEVCGFGPWEAGQVTINADGTATILTGSSPHGQGHETTWAQIAADVLQIPFEDIDVKHSDTGVVPRGVGTFGSRSAPVGGSAVLNNSNTVKDKATSIAAHMLEAAVPDMILANGQFQVRGVPEKSLSWTDVAKAAESDAVPEDLRGTLSADEDFSPPGETFPFGTHICAIEIEQDTGELDFVHYWTVDDCGKVINPLIVEGQVHGGIAQGMGQALFEGVVYDDIGNLVTGSFMDYAMPRAHLLPSFDTNRTETPSPLNPLGVKGIGEAATIGSTPAVANAVIDALSHLGVSNINMPLTSEKIWQILQQG